MSEKTAVFLASVDNLNEDSLVNLIKDVRDVGKKYNANIFFDEMIEFKEVP